VTTIFPSIIVGLSLAASVVYALTFDWGRAVYWLAGATINATATWWIR
jgi:hypothetical protein